MPLPDWRLRLAWANDASSRVLLLVVRGERSEPTTGSVTGPRCVYSSTLPATYAFAPLPPSGTMDPRVQVSSLDIPESCLWEPEHPFLYAGNGRLADLSIPMEFGLRSLAVRDRQLWLHGQPYWLRGLVGAPGDEEALREHHRWGCRVLLSRGPLSREAVANADRFGPFVAAEIPKDTADLAPWLANGGVCHPALGIWWSTSDPPRELVDRIRAADPACLVARWVRANPTPVATNADLLLIEGTEEELSISSRPSTVPWLAVVARRDKAAKGHQALEETIWREKSDRLDSLFANAEGCVGWVIES